MPLITRALLSLSVLILAPSVAQAETIGADARMTTFEIRSDLLEETREVYVRTPLHYNPQDKTYPVVYVLDGEWNFEFVAAYLDYMADNYVFPEVIVTGVRNVNRNRDYVPRPDSNFADTGEAGAFLGFVRNEWITEIDETYPVSGERVLVGHSFGGVFTLHTLFSEPSLFDAYIALGSSAWIGDGVLMEEANAFFSRDDDADAFVYMAVGEGDGGPTVPSSKALAEIFQTRAPASLDWTFDITPQTDHFKNVSAGLNDAFMALFPAWGFVDDMKAAAAEDGASGVDAWFAEKRDRLGWRFHPAWFDMGVAAFALTRDGHGGAAIALIENLKTYYPDNAHVADFAASVYEQNGETARAAEENARALALIEQYGLHPNALHRDRLDARADRLNAATDTGE